MNSDNFADFLHDYSKLYQLPFEELKSLVMQYPYCTNLHYLLAEKSQLDQRNDSDHYVNIASFYSQDRAALRQLIQKLKFTARQMESFELAEDYLELKDLSEVHESSESFFREEAIQSEPVNNQLMNYLPPLDEEEASEDNKGEEIVDLPDFSIDFDLDQGEEDSLQVSAEEVNDLKPDEAGAGIEELFDQLIAENSPFLEEENIEAPILTETSDPDDQIANPELEESPLGSPEVEEPPQKSESMDTQGNLPANQPQPTPKSSFSSWVQQFQPAHVKVQLGELMESKKRDDSKRAKKGNKKKKKSKDKVVLFAERSLKDRKDLASETLAELLVTQEQYSKAIQMYERLILKFPEKSSYFADKIENLKNL